MARTAAGMLMTGSLILGMWGLMTRIVMGRMGMRITGKRRQRKIEM
jgi:hypothetical protein